MAELTYKFTGVNTAQLAREVQILRQNSSTFRALEAAATAAGYTTIEVNMGASLVKSSIADSTRVNSSTRRIRINSDESGSWGVDGRQATVGEVIAHELAHAVVPLQYQNRVLDQQERDSEGMWVRRQAGGVARDLGLPGANNADQPITIIPINETQGCTERRPQGDGSRDGVLFLDGSRGYNGKGSTVPPGAGSQDPINSRQLATDKPPALPFDPSNDISSTDHQILFDNRSSSWSSSPLGDSGDLSFRLTRELQNYPRSAFHYASAFAAPSLAAFNALEFGSGPRPALDFQALAQTAAHLLHGAGQYVGNNLIPPAEGASLPYRSL